MASAKNVPSDEARCRIARLLCRHWELLTPTDQAASLLAAHVMGAELADAALEDGDVEAVGDASDYRRVCVKFAADCGEANDVEVCLWSGVDADPRMASFFRGFWDRRRGL